MKSQLLHDLRGTLVVSCQADAGTPLDGPEHIAALAASVVAGGASAVRIEGLRNIAAVRSAVDVPVIGLVKKRCADTDVYITPTVEDVRAIAAAGASLVAFDATDRPRPASIRALVAAAHGAACLAMADVSTAAEARAALAGGADIVSTTMAGYTPYSRNGGGPDFALMEALARAGLPFAAEGRVWTPEEALRCFEIGADFVVVGSAITRPTLITERFTGRIAGQRDAAPAARKALP